MADQDLFTEEQLVAIDRMLNQAKEEVRKEIKADAARSEQEQEDKPIQGRVLHAVQSLYHPDDYIYERDANGKLLDGYPKLKEGAKPLLTREKIEAYMAKKRDSWEIAYILHDQDKYTKEDEYSALERDPDTQVRAGETKLPHFHIIIRGIPRRGADNKMNYPYIRLASVSKALGIPENNILIPHGRNAWLGALAYLIHQTVEAIRQKKHEYDPDDVRANFNWYPQTERYIRKRRAKAGLDEEFSSWWFEKLDPTSKRWELKVWRSAVLYDGWTIRQIQRKNPDLYQENHRAFKDLRKEYLTDNARLPPSRLNILITGKPGTGKSTMARELARLLKTDIIEQREAIFKEIAFTTGTSGVRFQTYDGQPVIIHDDVKGYDLSKEYGTQTIMSMFNNEPVDFDVNVKYGQINLINDINIFCTIENEREFFYGLNGEINPHAYSPNIDQIYRRFPIIIEVNEDTYTLLINRQCIGEDTSRWDEYEIHSDINGSFKKLRRTFGNNYRLIRAITPQMLEPVIKAAELFFSAQEDDGVKVTIKRVNPDSLQPRLTSAEFARLSKFTGYGNSEKATVCMTERDYERAKDNPEPPKPPKPPITPEVYEATKALLMRAPKPDMEAGPSFDEVCKAAEYLGFERPTQETYNLYLPNPPEASYDIQKQIGEMLIDPINIDKANKKTSPPYDATEKITGLLGWKYNRNADPWDEAF